MALSDIAAGLEVTTPQSERGVATVDGTDATLPERLAPVADELPCSADEAATVVTAYADGRSVGAAAAVSDLPPVTAAKTLHRFGEPVRPTSPLQAEVVRDWIAGDCSRREAMTLADCGETTFALAVYVETHDPLPAARAAAEGALSRGRASDEKQRALGETMSDATDLF